MINTVRIHVTDAETITNLRGYLESLDIDPKTMSCRKEGEMLVYEGVPAAAKGAVTFDDQASEGGKS